MIIFENDGKKSGLLFPQSHRRRGWKMELENKKNIATWFTLPVYEQSTIN